MLYKLDAFTPVTLSMRMTCLRTDGETVVFGKIDVTVQIRSDVPPLSAREYAVPVVLGVVIYSFLGKDKILI